MENRNQSSAQERTRARIEELVQKFIGEGDPPDQAAAKAIIEIRKTAKPTTKKTTSSSPSEATTLLPKPKTKLPKQNKELVEPPTVLTTDAAEFIHYLNNESTEEIDKFIKNTFGNARSLAGSFKLKTETETENRNKSKNCRIGSNVDWDGLKRVYEEIEAKDFQETLAESLGIMNEQIKDFKKREKQTALLASIMVRKDP